MCPHNSLDGDPCVRPHCAGSDSWLFLVQWKLESMVRSKLETLEPCKGWVPALETHGLGSFHSGQAWEIVGGNLGTADCALQAAGVPDLSWDRSMRQ